jgi:hypothetical protein
MVEDIVDAFESACTQPGLAPGVDWVKLPIIRAKENVGSLYQVEEPVIDKKTYDDLMSRLESIEQKLPGELVGGDRFERMEQLKAASREAFKLEDKVMDVAFQTVVHCECGGEK